MSFLKDIKTAAEVEAERLESLASAARAKRDALLRECDYMAMPDYPSPPNGLLGYRQALRDITDQPGFPHSIQWPELAAVDAPAA